MNQDSANNIQQLHARVLGEVQGVGYRYFVIEQAQALGLRGYVRNEHNGNVEVLAQGPRPALERLVTQLQHGPSAAYVTEVKTTWGQPTEHYTGFHVRW